MTAYQTGKKFMDDIFWLVASLFFFVSSTDLSDLLTRLLEMDVLSLRAYQQRCRIHGPNKYFCPCGCGNEVIPGTALIISHPSCRDYSDSETDIDSQDGDPIYEATDCGAREGETEPDNSGLIWNPE